MHIIKPPLNLIHTWNINHDLMVKYDTFEVLYELFNESSHIICKKWASWFLLNAITVTCTRIQKRYVLSSHTQIWNNFECIIF